MPETESNLVNHARRELALLGNGEEFDNKVLNMVEVFADMGHSGSSAFYTIGALQRLLQFQNLTELTNSPDEWMEVEMTEDGSCWQSLRRSDAFTYDPGFRSYYTLSEHGALSVREFFDRQTAEPTDDKPALNKTTVHTKEDFS